MRLDSVPASYMCVYTSTYAAEIDRRQRGSVSHGRDWGRGIDR